MKIFTISVADCAGLLVSVPAPSLETTLDLARAFARDFPGSAVVVSGDGAEYDGERWHDGLSEDERDAIDGAIVAGVRERKAAS